MDEDEIINLKEFLEERVNIIRNDYFHRNKDSRELIKADLGFPETAFSKLEDMCEYK
jgi:hypothetical protein